MLSFFLTLSRLLKVVFHGMQDRVFLALSFLYAIILLSATLFYHGVEKWSWLDSLLFAISTSATVFITGLIPQTSMGKVFTILYLLVSVGIFFLLVAKIAHIMLNANRRYKNIKQPDQE